MNAPRCVTRTADGFELRLRIVPNAGGDRVLDEKDGRLRVRIAAPPRDGRANRRLIAFLAGEFGVRGSQVELVRGGRGRDKCVRVHGPRDTPAWLAALTPA